MKYLISLLVVCLGAGCASRKEPTPQPTHVVPGTSVSVKRMSTVRTPEVVKSYSAGRYTDPNHPDEMHERHTVYRREQSPDWNYLPDPPPTSANGNAGYHTAATPTERHRVYAEALQEQNRALQKRIEQLRQQAGQVPGLQQEVDQLKKQIDSTPKPEAAPDPAATPPSEEDLFSSIEPELPAWGDLPDDQNFLFSQMRLNDECAAELAAAERRRISAVLAGPFQRRNEFVLFTP